MLSTVMHLSAHFSHELPKRKSRLSYDFIYFFVRHLTILKIICKIQWLVYKNNKTIETKVMPWGLCVDILLYLEKSWWAACRSNMNIIKYYLSFFPSVFSILHPLCYYLYLCFIVTTENITWSMNEKEVKWYKKKVVDAHTVAWFHYFDTVVNKLETVSSFTDKV